MQEIEFLVQNSEDKKQKEMKFKYVVLKMKTIYLNFIS